MSILFDTSDPLSDHPSPGLLGSLAQFLRVADETSGALGLAPSIGVTAGFAYYDAERSADVPAGIAGELVANTSNAMVNTCGHMAKRAYCFKDCPSEAEGKAVVLFGGHAYFKDMARERAKPQECAPVSFLNLDARFCAGVNLGATGESLSMHCKLEVVARPEILGPASPEMEDWESSHFVWISR